MELESTALTAELKGRRLLRVTHRPAEQRGPRILYQPQEGDSDLQRHLLSVALDVGVVRERVPSLTEPTQPVLSNFTCGHTERYESSLPYAERPPLWDRGRTAKNVPGYGGRRFFALVGMF